MKAASKASAGLEEHYRAVVAPGMEDTPTLRTIARETKKGLLKRVDVRAERERGFCFVLFFVNIARSRFVLQLMFCM